MKLNPSYCSAPAACLILLLFLSLRSPAQDSTTLAAQAYRFPGKLFTALNKKARDIEGKLDRQTEKYVAKLQRQEEKLQKKLFRKDSLLAKELFSEAEQQYAALRQTPQAPDAHSSVYSARLDSLSTALNFLKESNSGGLSAYPQAAEALQGLQGLQAKLNQTDAVKKYLQERREVLQQHLEGLGMVKELRKYQKQVYYYGAQVRQYKQLFEDPAKLEQKLLEVLVQVPAFRDFFARNSQLGQLFALPTSSGAATASLQGLQTRQVMEQLLRERFGSGPEATAALRQNVQQAQAQLSELKSKASRYSSGAYGNGGSSDDALPGFTPNNQKTKGFVKRLEWGSNFQSQRARQYFPVTTDLGLSLGYKLNDRSVVGVGAAYRLGWGKGWNDIRLSHQGVGLRSFVDWKLKGSIYISGGYEQNYRALIHSIDQLKGYSAWQKSGLIGVSKKYRINKKLKGSMQLLWDFLSYHQVPRTQAVIWRVGYSLK